MAAAPAGPPVVGDPDVEALVGQDVRQRLLRRPPQQCHEIFQLNKME